MADNPFPRPLPRPTSGTELYLAAVLDELRLIKAELIQPEPEPVEGGAEIELKEPVNHSWVGVAVISNPLPDDFPGKDALEQAGIISLGEVPRLGADLIEIPGIGTATANKILTWFKV